MSTLTEEKTHIVAVNSAMCMLKTVSFFKGCVQFCLTQSLGNNYNRDLIRVYAIFMTEGWGFLQSVPPMPPLK